MGALCEVVKTEVRGGEEAAFISCKGKATAAFCKYWQRSCTPDGVRSTGGDMDSAVCLGVKDWGALAESGPVHDATSGYSYFEQLSCKTGDLLHLNKHFKVKEPGQLTVRQNKRTISRMEILPNQATSAKLCLLGLCTRYTLKSLHENLK